MAASLVKLMSFRGAVGGSSNTSGILMNENILKVDVPNVTILPPKAKGNRRRISSSNDSARNARLSRAKTSERSERFGSKSKVSLNTMRSARQSVARKLSSVSQTMMSIAAPKEQVIFHVTVTGAKGSYTIDKEHRHFRKLHDSLKAKFPQLKDIVKSFPRIKFFSAIPDPNLLEEHRKFFEGYLHTLMKLQPRPADFNKFLEIQDHSQELRGVKKTGFNTLEDFELVRRIGEGSFGTVYLVRALETDEIFAMKVLKKEELRKKQQVEHTMTEMKVMSVSDHPFIVALKFAFHTEDRLFMITQFCPGGELFFHLKTQRKLSEDCVRLYSAEIASALHYLHEKFIIYRDLKPENILLDSDGHVLLTDFGLSRENCRGPHDAKTFCGTPEYLSPEMLIHRETKEGYGKGVDWWSLGILVFEMLYGLPPFYHKNLRKMCERILHKTLQFPDERVRVNASTEVKDLITGLLERDPSGRLGVAGDGWVDIESHPFFKEINWGKLHRKEYDPPYKPHITGDRFNVDNFDKEFTNKPARLSMDGKSFKSKNNRETSLKSPEEQDEFDQFDYSCFNKNQDTLMSEFYG